MTTATPEQSHHFWLHALAVSPALPNAGGWTVRTNAPRTTLNALTLKFRKGHLRSAGAFGVK